MGNEHTAHITSASNEESFIQQFGCLLTTDREPNHTLRDWRRSWTTTCKSFRSLSTCQPPLCRCVEADQRTRFTRRKLLNKGRLGLGSPQNKILTTTSSMLSLSQPMFLPHNLGFNNLQESPPPVCDHHFARFRGL